jgi:hypothetical protein
MNRSYFGVTVEMSRGGKFAFTGDASAVARGIGAGRHQVQNEAAKVFAGCLTVRLVEISARMIMHSTSAAPAEVGRYRLNACSLSSGQATCARA